jgi:hypothetical protein
MPSAGIESACLKTDAGPSCRELLPAIWRDYGRETSNKARTASAGLTAGLSAGLSAGFSAAMSAPVARGTSNVSHHEAYCKACMFADSFEVGRVCEVRVFVCHPGVLGYTTIGGPRKGADDLEVDSVHKGSSTIRRIPAAGCIGDGFKC